jgi:predicted phage baseplate assembly protein
MRLPDITLDDRRFQDLVNEARHRIAEACPEWTEHNVSDPGITLIELFAWMTEMVIYRLNRVPDKLHIRLMDLVQLKLEPPTAAAADLTFRLAAPAEREPVHIPAATEVATMRAASEEPIVFQTDGDFTIPAATPVAYLVERNGEIKDVGVAGGVARPKGSDQLPFGMPPAPGDALYLGFDTSLARLLMQVTVDCGGARGPGVDPEDPCAGSSRAPSTTAGPTPRSCATRRAASTTAAARSTSCCPTSTSPGWWPGSGSSGCAAACPS